MTPLWPERVPGVRLEPLKPAIKREDLTKDNGYYYLCQIIDKYEKEREEEIPSKMTDDESAALDTFQIKGFTGLNPQLDSLVKKYQPELDLLFQAGRYSYAQLPEVYISEELRPFMKFRNLASIANYYLCKQLSQKNKNAVEETKQLLTAEAHLSQGAPPVPQLISICTLQLTRIKINQLSRLGHLNQLQNKALSQFIIQIDKKIQSSADCFRYERLIRNHQINSENFPINIIEERQLFQDIFNPLDFASAKGFEEKRAYIVDRKIMPTLFKQNLFLELMGSTPQSISKNLDIIFSHGIYAAEHLSDPKVTNHYDTLDKLGVSLSALLVQRGLVQKN